MTNIKDIIPTLDDHARHKFSNAVELILLVSANYNHIQELDTLIGLFKGFQSEFWKHYPMVLQAYEVAAQIAEAEKAIRYEKPNHENKVDRDYLLETVVPIYCSDIIKHNKHWKNRFAVE